MPEKYDSIVFGGSGFIGEALLKKLAQKGERVLNLSRSGEVRDSVDFKAIDAKKKENLENAFASARVVYILLGQSHAGFQEEQEMRILENIFDSIEQFPPVRVIYCSSALVYGERTTPAVETDDLRPIEKYSQFKMRAEKYLEKRAFESGITLGIARLGNVYGDVKNRGFISFLMKKSLQHDTTELELNGDGEQRRDYVFVDDVATALSIFGEKLEKNDIVNIASGESTSLKEIVARIEKISGRTIEYTINGEKMDEAKNILVSIEKLKREYGFSPKMKLADGLKLTLDRYR